MNEELNTIRKSAEGKATNSQGWLLKSICKVLISIVDRMEKSEVNRESTLQSIKEGEPYYDYNNIHLERQRELNEIISNTISKKFYKGDSMKALILYKFNFGDGAIQESIIEVNNSLVSDAISTFLDNGKPHSKSWEILYVLYDGILFKPTTKPVLADVMTGIEI